MTDPPGACSKIAPRVRRNCHSMSSREPPTAMTAATGVQVPIAWTAYGATTSAMVCQPPEGMIGAVMPCTRRPDGIMCTCRSEDRIRDLDPAVHQQIRAGSMSTHYDRPAPRPRSPSCNDAPGYRTNRTRRAGICVDQSHDPFHGGASTPAPYGPPRILRFCIQPTRSLGTFCTAIKVAQRAAPEAAHVKALGVPTIQDTDLFPRLPPPIRRTGDPAPDLFANAV